MTIDEFLVLPQLHGIRQVGPGKWIAKCPSHDDRHPSLSFKIGQRAILARCWAGCTLEQVCASLGITVSSLFYDHDTSHSRQPQKFKPKPSWRVLANQLEIEADFHWIAAQELDPHDFESVGEILRRLELSESLRDQCFRIREDGLKREKEHHYATVA